MEEDFNFKKSNCVLFIASNYDKIKLHTDIQHPSLLNSEDGYEEDLKIWI